MPQPLAISDAYLFPLKRDGDRLTLLHEHDHLLRRFGQLSTLELSPGKQVEFGPHLEADRFAFVIEGEVRFSLTDQRELSPSRNASVEIQLSAVNAQGLLVPFGVALKISAQTASRMVLLSTHGDGV
jgi:dTDP-4-dehydrorhamnose 3,5-epimerase-like enzyme